jgi:hypothetical protein
MSRVVQVDSFTFGLKNAIFPLKNSLAKLASAWESNRKMWGLQA